MTRPLRLEFSGALYHVTSRGDRRGAIYHDDRDRIAWLSVLADTCSRYNFVVHAFCQMTNHYHLLVETIDGDLGRGLRQLNGAYSQYFNRRHGLVGHVFQGRYKAILVQKESYLLELARYVVLNPVRAGIVTTPEQWRWSSQQYFLSDEELPSWLETDWLLGHFGNDRAQARCAYLDFVTRGIGKGSPLRDVKHQVVLGDNAFIQQHCDGLQADDLCEMSRVQRRAGALPLRDYEAAYPNRCEAMARAYWSTAYSMTDIAKHFGVSLRTVSRAVSKVKILAIGKA
jgi:putative transposase